MRPPEAAGGGTDFVLEPQAPARNWGNRTSLTLSFRPAPSAKLSSLSPLVWHQKSWDRVRCPVPTSVLRRGDLIPAAGTAQKRPRPRWSRHSLRESPACPAGPLGSVPARAGPDELVAIFAFHLGERRVDRSGEARIVELNREVVAVGLCRALLPGGAELDVLRCTAKR